MSDSESNPVCFTVTVEPVPGLIEVPIVVEREDWDAMTEAERRGFVNGCIEVELENGVVSYARFDDPDDEPAV